MAAIQQLHGENAISFGQRATQHEVAHVPSGFAALDAMLGCGGVPLGAVTVLSGRTTSGKLTLAYKVLANAQRRARPTPLVAIVDVARATDPDYLARCGVNLDHLFLARPHPAQRAVDLMLDLTRNARKYRLAALLVDGHTTWAGDDAATRALNAAAPQLALLAGQSNCAVIFVDEAQSVWQRWLGRNVIHQNAAAHVELQREQWLERAGELVGYRARARLIKSRWARAGQSAPVEIEFNGTVKARDTW